MNKINILHVTFDMEIGGAEQVIRQLVEQGDHNQFNFSILCLDGKVGAIGQEMKKQHTQVIAFNRQQGIDFLLLKQLHSYLKTNQIDIIHCHQYTPYFYGVLASIFTKTRVIFTEHGRFYPDTRKIKRWLINPALSLLTEQITAISQATVDALIKLENFPIKKIKKIYNGINYPFDEMSNKELTLLRQQLNFSEQDIILGTVSRLDSIKNQALMINLIAKLTYQGINLKLLVVGDGPEQESLKKLSVQLNVAAHIVFTGFKINPNPYLQLMDIFLLTSQTEGTSITLLEAMACGKPAIVTNVGGNPEVVVDQKTGIVIEADDLEGLQIATLTLINNELLRCEYSKNAKKRFVEKFNVAKMNDSYQKIYQRCS